MDISGVCKSLPGSMCDILPAVHALTSCDATSASVGKGQSAGYQFALSIPALREDLRHLGVSFEVSEELQRICEKFVCSLYGSKTTSINECRYEQFCTQTPASCLLPPNLNALRKHVQWANYQTANWRLCYVKLNLRFQHLTSMDS